MAAEIVVAGMKQWRGPFFAAWGVSSKDPSCAMLGIMVAVARIQADPAAGERGGKVGLVLSGLASG